MPLRDHFHPPLDLITSWDVLHGAWPVVMTFALNPLLPPGYVAGPRVHLGAGIEVDVGVAESDGRPVAPDIAGGTVATLVAPADVAVSLALPMPLVDAYEVRVYDTRRGRQLVAAIELVSPANKDRPASRREFVAKCAALLQEGVAVTVVDVVTTPRFNLFGQLLAFVGGEPPAAVPPIYLATFRPHTHPSDRRLDAEMRSLAVGRPLPPVTVWLPDDLSVTLDLEATYEAACAGLRIP